MAVFVWVWEVCAVVAVAIRAAASLNEGKEEGQVGRGRGQEARGCCAVRLGGCRDDAVDWVALRVCGSGGFVAC